MTLGTGKYFQRTYALHWTRVRKVARYGKEKNIFMHTFAGKLASLSPDLASRPQLSTSANMGAIVMTGRYDSEKFYSVFALLLRKNEMATPAGFEPALPP